LEGENITVLNSREDGLREGERDLKLDGSSEKAKAVVVKPRRWGPGNESTCSYTERILTTEGRQELNYFEKKEGIANSPA